VHRLRGERHVQRDDVGHGEEVVEVGDESGKAGVVAGVVDDVAAFILTR